MSFTISALRAIVEMLLWCFIGKFALGLFAGTGAERNPIYAFFHLLTDPPRRCVARVLPKSSGIRVVELSTFGVLFLVWIGLAFLRNFI